MTDRVLTTPAGEVLFSSLRTARKNSYSGKLEYSARIEIDGDQKGAADFMKQLKKINKALVVTEDKEGNSIVKKAGNYIINARSKDMPKVFDSNNTPLTAETTPMIESGTVRLLLTTFEGKDGKGGGINLAGVQLIDITEYQGSEPVNEDELQKALNASHS